MARNPARRTVVRFSACTFVQVKFPPTPRDGATVWLASTGCAAPYRRGYRRYGRRPRKEQSRAVTVLCRVEATSSRIELSVVQSLQHSPPGFRAVPGSYSRVARDNSPTRNQSGGRGPRLHRAFQPNADEGSFEGLPPPVPDPYARSFFTLSRHTWRAPLLPLVSLRLIELIRVLLVACLLQAPGSRVDH
jgi:hypothetical protein